jgi:hypothetical protein
MINPAKKEASVSPLLQFMRFYCLKILHIKESPSVETTNGAQAPWWPFFENFKTDICKFIKRRKKILGIDNIELY